MWRKDDSQRPVTKSAPTHAPSTHDSVIAEGCIVDGNIRGSKNIRVEGLLNGDMHLQENHVSVVGSGKVSGTIHASTIVIEGTVDGDLIAEDRIEVGPTGNITGNIKAPRMSLDDGAQFKGSIDMNVTGSGDQEKQDKDAEQSATQ